MCCSSASQFLSGYPFTFSLCHLIHLFCLPYKKPVLSGSPAVQLESFQIQPLLRFRLSSSDTAVCSCSLPYYPSTPNMPRKGRKATKPWSLHPILHDEVADLLYEDDLDSFKFLDVDNDNGMTKAHDTNIMGHFICRNGSCKSDGWPSKKIATTIRMYPDKKYNARVYNQRCKNCNMIGLPCLDNSYAERVAYWLKKWNGIEVKKPPVSNKSKGPHNRQLCEGCKAGHCSESKDYLIEELNR